MPANFLVSLLALLFWLSAAIRLHFGMRRIESLDDVPPAADDECASLSVIVAACNEAKTIEPALHSLLSLDYPLLEVIVVDDRSTDETGAILDRLAAEHPRLRVIHVTELPPGWLGKNHALHVGSRKAMGEWLLFTDADVLYRPEALRRVMAWAARTGSGHVVVLPRIVLNGFWERLFVAYFTAMFNFRFQPWQASDPNSPAYMGIGAFNLVRTECYNRFSGHAALPLDVTDDMKLGKLMKARGARTGVIAGPHWVSVRWVVGLTGIIEGLAKNSFAGFDFRLRAAAFAALAILVFQVYPALALFSGGAVTVVAAATLVSMVCTAAGAVAPEMRDERREARDERRETAVDGRLSKMGPRPSSLVHRLSSLIHRLSPLVSRGLWGLGFPLAALIFTFILGRSIWLTYRRGGVLWRGTLYPLEELRRGVV